MGDKCCVSLLQTYLRRRLPPKVKEKESADFYWKPKDKTPLDEDGCWFTMQACGRNFVASVVKSVCEPAGIHGKTNHSSRAGGANQFFAANVPGKLSEVDIDCIINVNFIIGSNSN